MEITRSHFGSTLFGLIDRVRSEAHNFVRQEIELAKAEISEKLARQTRNGVFVLVGGMAAHAALILLLLSLSFLLASWFETLGLSTGIALCLGFLALALVVGFGAGVVAMVGIRALSKESLTPEKTIQVLGNIKKNPPEPLTVKPLQSKPNPEGARKSDEIVSEAEKSRRRIQHDLIQIRERFTLTNLTKSAASLVKSHPVRSVAIGLGTGLAGWIMLRGARLFNHKHIV